MSTEEFVRRIDRAMTRVEAGVLGLAVLGIAGVGIANVFARNLLGGTLPFAEEVNRALMVWMTFAGIGLGARRARHIRMAAFYDQLRGRSRKAAWMAITAGTSLLLWALAWWALRYVLDVHAIGRVTPALRVPLWIAYSVVPVGLALGALEYSLTLLRNLTGQGVHASFDLEEDEEAPVDAP